MKNFTPISYRDRIRDTNIIENAEKNFTDEISRLRDYNFYETIRTIEDGESIGYENAFLGFLYVVASGNSIARSRYFPHIAENIITQRAVLFLMSMRFMEERGRISGSEIAGMIAVTQFDFTFLIEHDGSITETCGMGGDIGFGGNLLQEEYMLKIGNRVQQGFQEEVNRLNEDEYYNFLMENVIIPDRQIKGQYSKNKKSVNISTLVSLLLGSLDYKVMKHGSTGNTSKVGSSDAIKDIGASVVMGTQQIFQQLFDTTGYIFTDAVVTKTIHDISGSILKTETVNHLTGPMTLPISRNTRLDKVLGINHNIDPKVLGETYELLREKGIYNIGNVIIIGGFGPETEDTKEDLGKTHKHICFDEFSPYGSMVGIVINGKFLGTFFLSSEDFGVHIEMGDTLIPGVTSEILTANNAIIENTANESLINLVACNAALGIIVSDGSMEKEDFIIGGKINQNYLNEAYEKAKFAISSGLLKKYVQFVKEKVYSLSSVNEAM